MRNNMQLNEALDRLNRAGLICEEEQKIDRSKELSEFLKSHKFRHKPHSIFGLYKPIRRTPYEFFAMFGMGDCNITVSYWDWDKNKRVSVGKIDVKYNEDPDAFKKIEDFINEYEAKLR